MRAKREGKATKSNFPVFVATTTPQEITLASEPYVGWVAFRGYTPMIDVRDKDGKTWTMIINQVSVSRQLDARFPYDNGFAAMRNSTITVSRVAPGRMAPYKID